MTKDVGHLFMGLFTICPSSLDKYLFISFAHFYWAICILTDLCSSLYVLEMSSLLEICLCLCSWGILICSFSFLWCHWFWYDDNVDLIEWVGMFSLCFSFFLYRICIIFLTFWVKSPVEPFGSGVFFVGRFLKTDSVYFIDNKAIWSICFFALVICLSRNLSSSRLRVGQAPHRDSGSCPSSSHPRPCGSVFPCVTGTSRVAAPPPLLHHRSPGERVNSVHLYSIWPEALAIRTCILLEGFFNHVLQLNSSHKHKNSLVKQTSLTTHPGKSKMME